MLNCSLHEANGSTQKSDLGGWSRRPRFRQHTQMPRTSRPSLKRKIIRYGALNEASARIDVAGLVHSTPFEFKSRIRSYWFQLVGYGAPCPIGGTLTQQRCLEIKLLYHPVCFPPSVVFSGSVASSRKVNILVCRDEASCW